MRIVVSLAIAFAVAILTNHPIQAQKKKAPPSPAIDLKGKTLKQVFEELLPGMGAADLAARNAPQQAWQKICFAASAPDQEKMRLEVCTLMAGKLGSDVSIPARVWLLQQLQRIGKEESVDAVAAAAKDKQVLVRDEAVRCLANIPSPKATARLVSLLKDADASARVGVLNALGHRQDREALGAIAKELAGKEKAIVQAAARALGRMPGAEAGKALATVRKSAPKEALAAINDAYLSCADELLKEGKLGEARAIYTELNNASEPKGTRLAALRGVLRSSGDEAGGLVLHILRDEEPLARQVAIAHIESLSAAALKTVGEQLEKLPVPSQVMVLTAMAARGDKSLLPISVRAASSKDEAVAKAGVQALGKLGDASVVPLLLEKAAGKSSVGAAAMESLSRVEGEEVNRRLIALLEKEPMSPSAVRIVEVLGRRKAISAIPVLLRTTEHADASLRLAAFGSLGAVAEPKDVRPMILAYLKLDAKARSVVAPHIVEVCLREADSEKRAEPVRAILSEKKEGKSEVAVALLPLLGKLGGKKALQEVIALRGASADLAVSRAASDALFSWPDDAAAPDLAQLVGKASETDEKRKAIRALARVCAIPGGSLEAQKKLDLLKQAMAATDRDDERRVLLDNIGFVRHIDTLRFVLPYLDNKALAQSACRAVVELAHSKMLREPNRAEFHKALDRVIALCKDKGLVERARDYKNQP